jgi:hypothetical protein
MAMGAGNSVADHGILILAAVNPSLGARRQECFA